MTLRPIRNDEDYETALEEIEALWNAEEGTPEIDRLDILVLLVEAYEAEHYLIPDPDPIELILHVMDARGLTRRDLEPYLGSRARVSEILNRRRPLSLEMIRKLQMGLGLPADVLVQSYELEDTPKRATTMAEIGANADL
ncbi:MAG: helix-turn-helix domain-containing protein [Caldilineaceae bacterium]|nr:helix-turn-helix domain-containing protein [Caldilineaceae bacterium]